MWIVFGLLAGCVLGLYDIWTKQAVQFNKALPVVVWSSAFGALCWLPFVLWPLALPNGAVVGSTSLSGQLLILPKSLAMAASWAFAYYSIKGLPISIAGAVRASGPLWTLLGGMLFLAEFISFTQFFGLTLTVLSYYIFTIVGRKEGVFRSEVLSLFLMLLATLLSAGVTVYDKYIIHELHLASADVQAWSAQQRFVLVLIFALVLPGRSENLRLARWSWAIPLVGVSWVGAELIYFQALADPEAKVAYLAVFRRMSLVVGFLVSIFHFGERYIFWKSMMVLGLLAGIATVILG